MAPRRNLTEPVPVPCLFCTDTDIEATEHFVRIVGWVDLPTISVDQPEGRIIARLVMPPESFRKMLSAGRRKLARGEH